MTCVQATPSPGSRSNTMRSHVSRLSSREPRTWISSAPDCASATRSSTVSTAITSWSLPGTTWRSRDVFTFGGDVLLKEALAAVAFRTAHERERAADKVRPDPIPNRDVIIREILLGHADVGPIDAVGMGQANRSRRRRHFCCLPAARRPRILCRRGAAAAGSFAQISFIWRGFSGARPRARGLVLADALERSLPQHPAVGHPARTRPR